MNITLLGRLTMVAVLTVGAASAHSELLSRENVRTFRETHPCPLTGLTYNDCPGWVVTLIAPRCAGGSDDPANMQWLTAAAATAKDEAEGHQCPVPTPPSKR
jgi:hypothetical protein